MTKEQLAVANKNIDWHMTKFGYTTSNVEFKLGFIERLDLLDLEAGSFDIVISNCVINLSPDKEAVLRQVHRLLKPGGEMYFSDVYSTQRVPNHLRRDEVLWGECISGALYWNDFIRLAKQSGFKDPRLVEDSEITVQNARIQAILKGIRFFSATYRLWKIEDLEPDCEDYGQAVIYNGGIDGQPHEFLLDAHHRIITGKVFLVCGNTYRMLRQTRLSKYFTFIGDFSRHFGIFEGCGKSLPFASSLMHVTSSCC
jgi:SAM-dependent methyltransferase